MRGGDEGEEEVCSVFGCFCFLFLSDLDHEYKSKSVDRLVESARRQREKAPPNQTPFHNGLVDVAFRTRKSFLQIKDTDRSVGVKDMLWISKRGRRLVDHGSRIFTTRKYPLHSETRQIPASLGFPIPTVIITSGADDRSANPLQRICFIGRTSGLTVGHVRSLRTLKVFRNKRTNVFQHRAFWSLKMTRTRGGGRARKETAVRGFTRQHLGSLF